MKDSSLLFKPLNIWVAAILSLSIFTENVYAGKCPCDIYADGGTPCVAAHSTVRALYSSYNGPLYQVRRTSDSAKIDIPLLTQGGFVNTAVQDSFLKGKPGVILKVYDQSPQHNDVMPSLPGGYMPNGANPSPATIGKAMVGGHTVYGLYFSNSWNDTPPPEQRLVGYRNNNATGLAEGDQAEAMYMVVDGRRYGTECCMNYGNAEKKPVDEGAGTMECVNFGNNTTWGGRGEGQGPWVQADFENGIFKGDKGGFGDNTDKYYFPQNKTINANFVTAILKGPSGNRYTLKGGNAQSGRLNTMWDSIRPYKDSWGNVYSPKRLRGAIIIGTGGDNGTGGTGTFFEGAITIGNPPDWADDSIQANIVGAGYGLSTPPVFTRYNTNKTAAGFLFKVRYNTSNNSASFSYSLNNSRHLSMNLFDQRGRRIAAIVDGIIPAGNHVAVWNAKRFPSGMYVCRVAIDGMENWAGEIIVGK